MVCSAAKPAWNAKKHLPPVGDEVLPLRANMNSYRLSKLSKLGKTSSINYNGESSIAKGGLIR
jgi:hypothetical protein